MISIRSDADGLTEEYGRGDIVVQNPDDEDVIAMSVKDSAIQVKTNYHSGTISFKLSKKDYQEERNLNLLGLGKRTSWKLYQVHDRDGSACTEMLSSYVWNCVCVMSSFTGIWHMRRWFWTELTADCIIWPLSWERHI